MAKKNIYSKVKLSEEDKENLLSSYKDIPEEVKTVLDYNKYRAALANKLKEKYPELDEIIKNAPSDFNAKREYADKIAKDPKYADVYLKSEDVEGSDEYKNYINLKNRLPKLMQGNLSTSGTKEKSDVFGIRSALLETKAKQTYSVPGKSNLEISYGLSDTGEYTKDISNFEINPSDSYLSSKFKLESTEEPQDPSMGIAKLKNGLDFSSSDAYKKWLAFGHASGEFKNTPGHTPVSIKGKKKDVKHKLEDGIDTEEAFQNKVGMATGGISLASDITGAFLEKEKDKDIAKGIGTAATMAGQGAAIGGPWGAAIGGALGLGAGIYNVITGEKERKARDEKMVKDDAMLQTLSKISPTINTQAEMYEDGTYAAAETKPVEVEKDELVVRKNTLGKYYVVADFKGGKTHNQGGEDFNIQEGDVVFPGKKRSTIMRHLKAGNHAGIESERLRLPKDLPDTEEYACGTKHAKLQDGLNNESNPIETDSVKLRRWYDLVDSEVSSGIYTREEGEKLKKDITPGILQKPEKSKYGDWKEAAGLNDVYNPLSFMDLWGDNTTDEIVNNEVTAQEEKAASSPKPASIKSSSETSSREGIPDMLKLPSLGAQDLFGTDIIETDSMVQPVLRTEEEIKKLVKDQEDRESILAKEAKANAMLESGSTLENILDYAPAIGNIAKGILSRPEKVNRRFITPETMQYRDMSEGIRRQSDTQADIDRENASRFSGGSSQVARAGKSAAGAANIRRQQDINTSEVMRAGQIEAGNIDARNRAQQANIDLANQYDAMDAQNKAAIDAYFDQGLHDFGRISTQKSIDKKLDKMQDLSLNMMDTSQFGVRDKKVRFLNNGKGE
ncbi:hypothetical protein [Tenacibaculum sp.]|uniref:hypothetical protein n=1 Tax=Tenacibaculum sp. TaxID=1906242 RepID=UPI003D12A25A